YFTKEIRQLIVKAGDEVDEESLRLQARKDGSLTLREAGLEKVKMGIEPFLIAYAINLIVAQRLVRKLCTKCRKRVVNFDEGIMMAAELNIAEWRNYTIYEAAGCDECNGTGYKGRLAIHEALYFTKEIRQLIVKAGDEVDEESLRLQARKDGSLTLREAGLEKVKMGLTSIEEVLASTSES
ncbi:MAG TPA: hypothetical protein VF870_09695, partial [Ignavibacteriaceae bacterium]